MTSAALLEVENGVIVRRELIYDAEELRRAMHSRTHDADRTANERNRR
jgi:hypothetical protein